MIGYIKKKIVYSICLVVSILLVGCVDYEKLVEESKIAEEQDLKPVVLGDINGDGKEEKLAVEITTTNQMALKLYSGLKVVELFELEDGFDYLSLKAYVINVDADEKNEIVALINTSTRGVNVVKVINSTEKGEYELYDFPELVDNKDSYSGFGVKVTALEGFKYIIHKDNLDLTVDASRLYYLSMRNKESYEKIEEVWNKMVESEYHGESLGVSDVYVLNKSNGDVVLDVYECVVGGDDKVIGYLVTEMKYNPDGTYCVEQVEFKERIDVMP